MVYRGQGIEIQGATDKGWGISFGGNGNVLELDSGDGCITVNILKKKAPTELHTLKEWILWGVNYVSIKSMQQKRIRNEYKICI